MNDLPCHISQGKTFMYADDSTIIISDRDPSILSNKVSTVLEEFNQWCYNNRLIINRDKTVLVGFYCRQKSRSNFNFNFNFKGFTLAASEQVTFLGVILDQNFNFVVKLIKYAAG